MGTNDAPARAPGTKAAGSGAPCATSRAGMAQAALTLGSPREALDHCAAALDELDRHDDADARAVVFLVRAKAYRALGAHAAAYQALEAHHAVRSIGEQDAALEQARQVTAQLGLGRAQADAEAYRRNAANLENLSRIGQEITANLDTQEVSRLLQRHISGLLLAPAFALWLLDETGERLALELGIEAGQPVARAPIPLNDPDSVVALAVRERREICSHASALSAPLFAAGRPLGVVSIDSCGTHEYDEDDRSLFRALSAYAAIAIGNAVAYAKLTKSVGTLQSTQAELAVRTQTFERLSMTDALTGVANRRHLEERAAIEIAELRRKGSQLAVAMFDIDHFKCVNDTHGHAVGDIVLQHVTQAAKKWLRPADFIARVGGEEFALLFPGAGLHEAVGIAERIRASIARVTVVNGDGTVCVTTSFGVARFDPDTDSFDTVLRRADAALYAAKESGRDRVYDENGVPPAPSPIALGSPQC